MITGVGGFSGNLDEADTGAPVGSGAAGNAGGSPKKEARGVGGDSDEEEDEIEGLGTGEVYATDGDVSSDQVRGAGMKSSAVGGPGSKRAAFEDEEEKWKDSNWD